MKPGLPCPASQQVVGSLLVISYATGDLLFCSMPYLQKCPKCGVQVTTDGSRLVYCPESRCRAQMTRGKHVPSCWKCGGELIEVRPKSFTCFSCGGTGMMSLRIAFEKYNEVMRPVWIAEQAERQRLKAEQAERLKDMPIAMPIPDTNLYRLDGGGFWRLCKEMNAGATEAIVVNPDARRRNRRTRVAFVRMARRIGGINVSELTDTAID